MSDLSFSADVRETLADVVLKFGGAVEAQAIREGADIVLSEITEMLGVSFRELTEAWSVETHKRHGLYLGFPPDGRVVAYVRRADLQ